jgi:hypothetical protein
MLSRSELFATLREDVHAACLEFIGTVRLFDTLLSFLITLLSSGRELKMA